MAKQKKPLASPTNNELDAATADDGQEMFKQILAQFPEDLSQWFVDEVNRLLDTSDPRITAFTIMQHVNQCLTLVAQAYVHRLTTSNAGVIAAIERADGRIRQYFAENPEVEAQFNEIKELQAKQGHEHIVAHDHAHAHETPNQREVIGSPIPFPVVTRGGDA